MGFIRQPAAGSRTKELTYVPKGQCLLSSCHRAVPSMAS